jgi:hypothetical protein
LPAKNETTRYEEHKSREANRSRKKSEAGRDIGELPPVKDPARREACRLNLRLFLESYLAEQFFIKFSPDHLLAISKLEKAIIEGGLFALAMPRASGKSTLVEGAALWAVLYGHRRFVAVIGAESDHAEEIAESLRVEIETNDTILEDFPEVSFPIQALDGIVNRCSGQLYKGKRTRIKWTGRLLRLPQIEGSASFGAIIKAVGITGRIRGMRFKLEDGSSLRPDLVLVDDPQTDESAASITQNRKRLKVLTKAILGLAGPKKKIAGAMPCTVIEPGDFIDLILDRQKYPQWQGQRTKLIVQFPESKKWETYDELWKLSQLEGRGFEDATQFYQDNFEEMSAGGEASWAERYNPDEIDAFQHARNLMLERGMKAYQAEYQNEPQSDEELGPFEFDTNKRQNALAAYEVPTWASKTTAFIDVQGEALFYCVMSFAQNFTCAIVDYGIYPKQRAGLVHLADLTDLLSDRPGGLESRMADALRECVNMIRDKYTLDAIGIDANWGLSNSTVHQVASQLASSNVHAMNGHYFGAASSPINAGKPKPGETRGYYHRRIRETGKDRILFDSNAWKSTVKERLLTEVGDPGALTVFQGEHWLLDEHLHSEFFTEVYAKGNRKEEWKLRLGFENHWWDCVVGCCVLASYTGCALPSWQASGVKRVSFADMQRAARLARDR